MLGVCYCVPNAAWVGDGDRVKKARKNKCLRSSRLEEPRESCTLDSPSFRVPPRIILNLIHVYAYMYLYKWNISHGLLFVSSEMTMQVYDQYIALAKHIITVAMVGWLIPANTYPTIAHKVIYQIRWSMCTQTYAFHSASDWLNDRMLVCVWILIATGFCLAILRAIHPSGVF